MERNSISKYGCWVCSVLCSVPDVEVVQVEQKDVPIYGEWIGTLDGLTNADDGENQSGANGFDSGISEEIV